jgi:hypothetical protein
MSLRLAATALLELARGRDSFDVPLPRLDVPCSVWATGETPHEHTSVSAVAQQFLHDQKSDLLVTLGEFGSGKSDVLRRVASAALDETDVIPLLLDYADIAHALSEGNAPEAIEKILKAHSDLAPAEFDRLLREMPRRVLLLIDGFDEFNFSLSAREPPPDLRAVSSLLLHNTRVVVAARRSITASPDAFIKQLNHHGQAKQLGARSYMILELTSCSLTAVKDVLKLLPTPQAEIMEGYLLTRGSAIHLDRVRRPLFLQMLIDLPSHTFAGSERFSMYQLYDFYIDMVLERDGRKSESYIPLPAKRQILQTVAHEMFEAQVKKTPRVSPRDVKALVAAEVASSVNDEWVGRVVDPEYDWSRDFVRSNPLLVAQAGAGQRRKAVTFIHQSIFEFCLTQHFATRFDETGAFGLEDDAHSVRAFDSLLPYFLRSTFGAGHEHDLRQLVADSTTSNLDRLLGFFFLEDDPQVLELLNSVRIGYEPFLRRAEATFDSYFMSKIVRYQLVLLGRGIGQALAYVSDARVREVDEDQDIEVHTFAAGQGPTEFLQARLFNTNLANALPITVYRLGQFGDMRAVEALEIRAAQNPPPPDPCFSALVEEAIERIRERTEVEPAH